MFNLTNLQKNLTEGIGSGFSLDQLQDDDPWMEPPEGATPHPETHTHAPVTKPHLRAHAPTPPTSTPAPPPPRMPPAEDKARASEVPRTTSTTEGHSLSSNIATNVTKESDPWMGAGMQGKSGTASQSPDAHRDEVVHHGPVTNSHTPLSPSPLAAAIAAELSAREGLSEAELRARHAAETALDRQEDVETAGSFHHQHQQSQPPFDPSPQGHGPGGASGGAHGQGSTPDVAEPVVREVEDQGPAFSYDRQALHVRAPDAKEWEAPPMSQSVVEAHPISDLYRLPSPKTTAYPTAHRYRDAMRARRDPRAVTAATSPMREHPGGGYGYASPMPGDQGSPQSGGGRRSWVERAKNRRDDDHSGVPFGSDFGMPLPHEAQGYMSNFAPANWMPSGANFSSQHMQDLMHAGQRGFNTALEWTRAGGGDGGGGGATGGDYGSYSAGGGGWGNRFSHGMGSMFSHPSAKKDQFEELMRREAMPQQGTAGNRTISRKMLMLVAGIFVVGAVMSYFYSRISITFT